MAKVLQTKRTESVSYSIGDATYSFMGGISNPDCHGMEMIKNDDHAELLLKLHDDLSVVPENKWPEKYKKNLKDYVTGVTKEAVEKFPMLKDKILGEKKIHKEK
jgi:hypothetical protein